MPNLDTIRKVLESDQTIQRLAAVEHERWAHWQQYVHEHCERLADGSLVIPPELVARWETQIATPYSELSEKEKKSDEDQVRLYLPVVIEALTT
jgi:hypothetical protein